MSLSPLEIENIQFTRSFLGGYDRNEVERFLAQVARSIDEYVSRIDQQQRQIQQLEAELQLHRENEDLLRSSVVHAQRSADELVAAARQRAETIKGEAALEADRLRHSLADLKNEREQFEFAFHGMLTGFIRRLEHNNPALLPAGEPTRELPGQAHITSDAHSPVTSSVGDGTVFEQPASYPAKPEVQVATPPQPESGGTGLDTDALDFEQALRNA